MRELSNTSQHSWSATNAKNIYTTRNSVEDDVHGPSAGEKVSDHMEEDCPKEIRCIKCRQDHPANARPCDVYKREKEKEILEVKHKRNESFLEVRKIVGTYMGENSYASVARRMDTINQDNKYRVLVQKLIKLEQNDWSKFQGTWKIYTRSNFTKYHFNNNLRIKRNR